MGNQQIIGHDIFDRQRDERLQFKRQGFFYSAFVTEGQGDLPENEITGRQRDPAIGIPEDFIPGQLLQCRFNAAAGMDIQSFSRQNTSAGQSSGTEHNRFNGALADIQA